MTDRIRLQGVRAHGFHGVFEHEKRNGQDFVVDVDLVATLAPAAATDDLTQTVHYGEVAAQIVARIEGEPFDLIEALAGRIAAEILTAHRLVDEVTVTVHKPQAPVGVDFADVAVEITRRRDSVPVVVALGANMGDAAATLDSALVTLAESGAVTDLRVSASFVTEPVGGPDQPAYVNRVVTARSRWSAPRLLAALHAIEADHGRERTVRWGPRTLDLDLIQWGEPGTPTMWHSDRDDLGLPHPRARERAFVLVPWLDVDPHARLAVGAGVESVAALVAALDTSGVRRLEDRS